MRPDLGDRDFWDAEEEAAAYLYHASARAATPPDPVAPRRGPLGSSPDRDSAIGNVPALVPGPLARLQDLQLLTELSPQASAGVWTLRFHARPDQTRVAKSFSRPPVCFAWRITNGIHRGVQK
jgi:hypothetical protein